MLVHFHPQGAVRIQNQKFCDNLWAIVLGEGALSALLCCRNGWHRKKINQKTIIDLTRNRTQMDEHQKQPLNWKFVSRLRESQFDLRPTAATFCGFPSSRKPNHLCHLDAYRRTFSKVCIILLRICTSLSGLSVLAKLV